MYSKSKMAEESRLGLLGFEETERGHYILTNARQGDITFRESA